jgi:hypothetical protein
MWQTVAGLSSSPANNSPASIEEATSTIVLVLAFLLVVSLSTIHVDHLFMTPIGGRAAGDGETTADQQYFFNATSNLSKGIGFPLSRDAQNNGIGPGNQCLTLNRDGFLSNTPCSPPNFTPEQSWVVGDAVAVPSPAVTSTILTSSAILAAATPVASASSTTPPATATATPPAPTSATAPETFVLPPPGRDGPGKSVLLARRDSSFHPNRIGPTFDTTATRAATGAQIRSAASPDICFDVSNFRAGDFRFNLVPVALKKCDASVAGQKFDLVTKVGLSVSDCSCDLPNTSCVGRAQRCDGR